MNCHICDKPTVSFHHEKTNITYYNCEACQYIFKSPECHQDLSTQKERYNLHENDENDPLSLKKLKKNMKFQIYFKE